MASRRHSYGVQRATRSTCRIVGERSAPGLSTAHARMHALARAQECQLTAGHGPRPRARGSVRRLRVSRCKPCSMRRMCMPSHASPHVPGMGDRLQRAALGAAAVPPNLPPGGAAHPCACARASRHVAGASRRAAGALARHRSCVHAATCPSARVFVQRVRVASSHVRAGRTRRSQPGALSSTHARTRARTNACGCSCKPKAALSRWPQRAHRWRGSCARRRCVCAV